MSDSEAPRLKKISVANQKGGVGKTTSSVNLAACLAAANYKTLLIDLDPQGNATSGLGIDRYVSNTIYDVLIGKVELEEAIQDSYLPNLKVIPANQNLIGAEVELINAISREKKLKTALKKLTDDYSFVIFDCPPSLGLLTINAFTASDSLLIPLQCEYYALEGLGQLLNTYQIVKEDLNEDLQIEGILLTMYDARNKLTHEVEKEMHQHFPKDVLETKVPRNIKLSEAPSFGRPVVLYDIDSKGCHAYLDLASEILVRNHYPKPDWKEFISAQREAQRDQAKPAPEENTIEAEVHTNQASVEEISIAPEGNAEIEVVMEEVAESAVLIESAQTEEPQDLNV